MSILVIGATGGIGSALSRALVEAGSRVHLMARDEGKLAALAAELSVPWSRVDVRDRDGLRHAIEMAGSELTGLAYMVGSINLKPLKSLKDQDFLDDFALNALGAAAAIQAALPALQAKREHPSSVVLVSSVAVAQGFAAHASVSMAKGAIEGLTRALAAELAPSVRVNAIAPSLTRTTLAARLLASEPMAQALAAMHPMQRLGTPEDVAAMAAFLLSPTSGWITGQVIGVDGGRATLRTKG